MMNRREFARRCGLIALGVVAADQLDVLEVLAPRRLFAGADFAKPQPELHGYVAVARSSKLVEFGTITRVDRGVIDIQYGRPGRAAMGMGDLIIFANPDERSPKRLAAVNGRRLS